MSRSPCARSSRSMPAQVGLEHRIAWKPTANADLRAAMGRLLPAVLTFQHGARRSSVVACPSRSATPRSRYGSKRFGVLGVGGRAAVLVGARSIGAIEVLAHVAHQVVDILFE